VLGWPHGTPLAATSGATHSDRCRIASPLALRVGRTVIHKALLAVVSVILACGCVSGGQASLAADDGVELAVQNNRQVRVTAFVLWDTSRPVRLGEVEAGETATFRVRVRGLDLRVMAGNAASPSPAGRAPAPQQARRGDRFLWVFQANGFIDSARLN